MIKLRDEFLTEVEAFLDAHGTLHRLYPVLSRPLALYNPNGMRIVLLRSHGMI